MSSTTLLHRAPRHDSPWVNHHLWYQARPGEIPTTQAAIELISHLARHGMHVLTLPALSADDDPDYLTSVTSHGARRSIRVLPNIGSEAFAARGAFDISLDDRLVIAAQWLAQGAHGLELGSDTVEATQPSRSESGHYHAGWNVQELQAWMKYTNDDAAMSISLRGPTIADISDHALDDYFDVLRFELLSTSQLTAHNYFDQSVAAFRMFDAVGTLPSWNASWEFLNNVPSQLSQSALLLAICYMPGIVHFEKDVHLQSPSTRHALRVRDSLRLYKANVLIDTTNAGDGFVWLFNDEVSMLLNFGPHSYEIPNDGRVLVSSMITLPERGSHLALPPGEVAWLRRSRTH